MVLNDTGPQSASATVPPELLVLRRSPPPKERADAARNRAVVLDAASALFAAHGVAGVSMDAIAAVAGVGKGTLFRRFGDKAGLAVALLDDRERALQEAVLSGPPPLGPGTADEHPAPVRRLSAFVAAYIDYVLAHLDLVRLSETGSPGARYRLGAYRFWRRHVSLLLAAGGAGEDPESMADTLLAPLAAEHLHAVVAEQGQARVRAAVLAFTEALLPGDRGGAPAGYSGSKSSKHP